MATLLALGPTDHGRTLALDEFIAGDYQEGYQYELIDGKLYVSPQPNLPYDLVETWISEKLRAYARRFARVINHVTNKARVFVPGRPNVTVPEPDVSVYRDFPLDRPFKKQRWEDVSPILVVEVLSEDDPDKDLVRNVELYYQVPTVKEYWLFDARNDPERPLLRVYRRSRGKWKIIDVPAGGTYETPLLPGFSLTLDVRA
jgi:Uma2 family endonuclease